MTRKKASMSASVPESPSALKSAVEVQGAAGQFPAMQAKNASMSASVPTSPSQLKSAEPQCDAGLIVRSPAAEEAAWPSGLVMVITRGPLGAPAATLRLRVTCVGSVQVTLLTVTP